MQNLVVAQEVAVVVKPAEMKEPGKVATKRVAIEVVVLIILLQEQVK